MTETDTHDDESIPVSPPVNVLLVVDEDIFDRLGDVVRYLCVGMMDEMVRVTVMSRSRGVAEAVGPSPVICVEPRHWPWSRLDGDDVLEHLATDRPTVVHCLSARLAGWVRDWVDVWSSGLLVQVTDRSDVHHLARLRCGPRVIAVATTPRLQEQVLTRCRKLIDRVRVAPLGVTAAAEPACLSQPDRVPAAVVTCRLTRGCGLHLVLRAMQRVVKSGQEVHLFVLASGPAETMFRRIVQQLDLRSHVTFAGRMQDWPATRGAMRGGDFYILPTTRRRFTISTLMAMGEGLAVIAPSDTIGDYLIDGQTASLFDPQAPGQLAERWRALLEDRAAARRLAQGALDHIRAHHQASAMVSTVAGLYRELGQSHPMGTDVASRA